MNIINKRQKIVLCSVTISLFNLLILGICYFYIINLENNNNIKTYNTNYEIEFNKKYYYIGLNEKLDYKIINPNNIKYKISLNNNKIATINNNTITGLTYGNTDIILTLPNNKVITSKLYVVKGMINRPNYFNYDKEYILCNYFSNEENKLLDKALEDRINNVSYKTRAAVVEAARFLTLNFNFRIPYFYENGRLNNYGGKEHVDAEGRYYHKGLYLSESKYDSINPALYGPAMWGCPLTNITKANGYGYYVGAKYPNGLDCSGFISWALYNGGFDVGDTGAGETYRTDDLYDLGEKTTINIELLKSNKVKVGDLIAYSGHIAMIIGIDENKYYIAETLPHLKGVVTKEYPIETILNTFTHIMLMDDVYKKDGNLTSIWY